MDSKVFAHIMGFVGNTSNNIPELHPPASNVIPEPNPPASTLTPENQPAASSIENRILLLPWHTLSLEESSMCVVEGILGNCASSELCSRIRDSQNVDSMQQSRIGSFTPHEDMDVRGDRTAWITGVWDNEKSMFTKLVHKLKILQGELGLRNGKVSIQLASYEPGGIGYSMHRDTQDRSLAERRLFTAVYFLNPGWDSKRDGGELEIVLNTGRHMRVAPAADRLVVFNSCMEHQVIPAKRKRWAITCWFYGSGVQSVPRRVHFKPTIFVAIPCYRDTQCQETIRDLFSKCSNPSNLFVGVNWQISMPEDFETCVSMNNFEYHSNVRSIIVPAEKARGPTVARRIIHDQLYQNETFILNIDSHMRFHENWDTSLLAMHRDLQSDKAILTTYPSGFEIVNGEARLPSSLGCSLSGSPRLVASHFDPEDHLLRLKSVRRASTSPTCSPFWAAGFNFALAHEMLRCVPYSAVDDLFFGEELLMAVRLWTHGWDFYTPHVEVVHHLWSRDYRPVFQPNMQTRKRAVDSVRKLLQGSEHDFQLGHARTLAAYQDYSGVCFADGIINFD